VSPGQQILGGIRALATRHPAKQVIVKEMVKGCVTESAVRHMFFAAALLLLESQ
jgi:hypothetical protein